MTQKDFENILEENLITWNDIVKITIYNPNYNIFRFRPKTLTFEGALGYHRNDAIVNLLIQGDKPFESINLYFNFEQILGINKVK